MSSSTHHIGDCNEQHPQLLPVLISIVVVELIPGEWILRPLLGALGFGPAGPIKGALRPSKYNYTCSAELGTAASLAAWMQSYFGGGAVEAGSWFSWLQAVGMSVVAKRT